MADMQVDGKILKDQVIYLPVTKDRAGNVVVVDTAVATFSRATASMGRSAGLQRAMPLVQAGGPTTVKYIPMTFQGHLEWQIEPQLVRMIPDSGVFRITPTSRSGQGQGIAAQTGGQHCCAGAWT